MKLVINEKIKHRCVGIAVIVSIGVIITPAILKQSQPTPQEHIAMAIQLPPAPPPPKIITPTANEMFASNEAITLEIQPLPPGPTEAIVKIKPTIIPTIQIPQKVATTPLIKSKITPKKFTKKITKHPVVISHNRYSVQIGTFSKQQNALQLTKKLQHQGYKVTVNKIIAKDNTILYKVLVGQTLQSQQAKHLQQQLTQFTKLQGFVVNTGVS